MSGPIYIECTLIRPGGTHVPMPVADGKTINYHFKPLEPDAAHIALVENEDHQTRFLAITEAYKFHSPFVAPVAMSASAKPEAPAKPAAGKAAPVVQQEPATLPQNSTAPIVPDQAPATGADTQPGDTDTRSDADKAIDAATDALMELPLEEVKAIYVAELGKQPHPNAKQATLVSQIVAKRQPV